MKLNDYIVYRYIFCFVARRIFFFAGISLAFDIGDKSVHARKLDSYRVRKSGEPDGNNGRSGSKKRNK